MIDDDWFLQVSVLFVSVKHGLFFLSISYCKAILLAKVVDQWRWIFPSFVPFSFDSQHSGIRARFKATTFVICSNKRDDN